MLNMEHVLKDRVALITGAGRGIGQAIALGFAREGARMVLAARSVGQLDETAARCRGAGAMAITVPTDVAHWDQVQHLVATALKEFGQVDILVNSAGVYGPIGPTASIDLETWVQALHVNLVGPFYLCRALLPHMQQRRQGKIILLGGGGATQPLPNFSSYAASKAGLARLADTLAEEMKGLNVQVNVIAPGLVDTQLQDEVLAAGDNAGPLFEKIKEAREKGVGAVSPEVAVGLAVFLASEASGVLTGKLIAAPYDPWRQWQGQAEKLNSTPLYAIRRLDPFTIKPLIKDLN
jgi:NAD(P)-dependent dehydrogenase (short-subunit alcohol dehydrogenase family)